MRRTFLAKKAKRKQCVEANVSVKNELIMLCGWKDYDREPLLWHV